MSDAREWAPMFLPPDSPLVFPDPRLADEEGLIAVGGDLSVDRLLFAYSHGIFPWFDDNSPPLWWSPDPRCHLPLDAVHTPRRLAQRMRRGGFELRRDTAFEAVMRGCGERRAEGSWIIESMVEAYVALHSAGYAESFEVWVDDALVGGLYGVRIGNLFAAESMFHTETDMSKIALVTAAATLRAEGVQLFDVQFRTEHLARFGVVEVGRDEYLDRVRAAVPLER